jgi:protease-4
MNGRAFAATIDAIYDDFVAKVAAGRERPVAEIEAVARGRVLDRPGLRWEAGLVDELAACGMPYASPESAPACPTTHLSSAQFTFRRWRG